MDYQSVTVEFSFNGNPVDKSNDIEKFLIKVIKSYFSIESVLDKEEMFDLLAYNFATSKLHFLVHATNSAEIDEFVAYISKHYRLWTGQDTSCHIAENTKIKEHMLLKESARIHTLEENWENANCSSLRCYLYDDTPTWMASHHIKKVYGNAVDYYQYLKIYRSKEALINLKSLAGVSVA